MSFSRRAFLASLGAATVLPSIVPRRTALGVGLDVRGPDEFIHMKHHTIVRWRDYGYRDRVSYGGNIYVAR